VGTAGMKDRHAVTRQWVSVPATAEPQLPQLDGDGVRLLRVSRHANKLKPGHLRGNRFRVLIRDVASDAVEKASPILERLRRECGRGAAVRGITLGAIRRLRQAGDVHALLQPGLRRWPDGGGGG